MTHTSYIELSRSALASNLDYLRQLVGDPCRVSLVVKGNAYGHGIRDYVPLAISLGAQHFSTFDASEAYEVCQVAKEEVTVMIMGMIDNDQLDWAIENEVEFYVFEFDRLKAAVSQARKMGKKARVHLELETGMNRTGFEEDQIPRLLAYVKKFTNYLEICGICTHYAGAENFANFIRVNQQYKNFNRQVKRMQERGVRGACYHTASSAATVRMPYTRMDMVRVGILQYGYWPNTETFITTLQPQSSMQEADPLRRVITWKSRIMNIKHVLQGDYVGYGTSFMAIQDMNVAIVPVGYGYGFSRSLSNTGRALVRGHRVSVVGMVNMNAMMLDVTNVDGVEKGDEVVIIGRQGDLSLSVSSFGEYSDQLNYELLTRLPQAIPRKVVD